MPVLNQGPHHKDIPIFNYAPDSEDMGCGGIASHIPGTRKGEW